MSADSLEFLSSRALVSSQDAFAVDVLMHNLPMNKPASVSEDSGSGWVPSKFEAMARKVVTQLVLQVDDVNIVIEPLEKKGMAGGEKYRVGQLFCKFARDDKGLYGGDDILAAKMAKNFSRYSEAEPLYKLAVAVQEKALGSDHPDTATSLNNLAGLYANQGRYSEAEPLYKRALAVREASLGSDHPDTAASLGNLAVLYDDQGRYSEAEPLYKRDLAVKEASLGSDHPDTATSLNNLAGLFDDQGRYSEAELLYKRALAVAEAALGSDHPNTATFRDNLAQLYRAQGRLSET